jgi:hypothetical protein
MTQQEMATKQTLLKIFIGILAVLLLGWLLIYFAGTIGYANKDGFQVVNIITEPEITTTTQPILVQSADNNSLGNMAQNQRGNVIYFGSSENSATKTFTVSPVSNSSEYGTKDMTSVITIPLGTDSEPYIIKQIYISKFGTENKTGNQIRISGVDNKNNQVNFAGLHYNLTSGDTPIDNRQNPTEAIFKRITQNSNPATGVFLDDVKTMFGGDMLANRINIFTDAKDVATTPMKIIITGYRESQPWKSDLLNNTQLVNSQNFPTGKQVLIRGITIGVPRTATAEQLKRIEGARFYLSFTNPYSNNIFTYPGPVNGAFIYTKDCPRILLPKMMITTAVPVIVLVDQLGVQISAITYQLSDQVSQGDITQFRLEYNLTDLRGSINPDYVCPNIQTLINKQLDSETIVDSIELQEMINTEKVKLSSNKDNLLTLMLQEEDIKRLEAMIKKINEIQSRRTQESDALAALQFTKQMNEVMRLRETLERRIRNRDKNTINFEIGINDADAAAAAGIPALGDIFRI